jgi:c-di-GMP-binding flagellar brake protein YcgR
MHDPDAIVELKPIPAPRHERRRYPRIELARACKLADGSQALPAITADVSRGGALLLIDAHAHFSPGQTVELRIAWDARPTVHHGQTIPARIVRVGARQGRTTVAIGFDQPVTLGSV